TSVHGAGGISDEHALSRGSTGAVGGRPADDAMGNADVVLAIGTRFSEMDTSSRHGDKFIAKGCEVIHIDIDPRQLGRTYPPVIAAVADARQALTELASLAESASQPKRDGYWKELDPLKDAWNEETSGLRRQDEVPF